MKADTDTDVLMSEINQIRDELSILDETVSTKRLNTIILDALPAEMYSTIKLDFFFKDTRLRLDEFIIGPRDDENDLHHHSERVSVVKSRTLGVGKMVGSQRCQLVSSLVITATNKVTNKGYKRKLETEMKNQESSIMRERRSGVNINKLTVI